MSWGKSRSTGSRRARNRRHRWYFRCRRDRRREAYDPRNQRARSARVGERPSELFSDHLADALGRPIDKPRNMAKA